VNNPRDNGEVSKNNFRNQYDLIDLYEAWNKPEKAKEFDTGAVASIPLAARFQRLPTAMDIHSLGGRGKGRHLGCDHDIFSFDGGRKCRPEASKLDYV
jgi:hypothetical protein